MNKTTTLRKLLYTIAFTSCISGTSAYALECTPDLHVDGKYLKDPNGNIVNLHGVMDTPSMWFNNDRWTSWDLGGYVEAACPRARDYFTKIFEAITDNEQGAYCDIFRLHMEPAWLRKEGAVTNGGEDDLAQNYDRNKVKLYLEKLFLPIAEDANKHGLYVIMRPPGVCPGDIQVGDAYQKYLLDVWDIVSSNEFVKANAGWLSLELANEPVRVKDKNGNRPTDGQWGPANGPAKTDFFQPIIDKIRSNGFTGIIWVPGEGYQSSYESYAKYPIKDNNFGYAIHVYSGWYGQEDNNCSTQSFITNMKKQVPHVDSKPIVITECDWSPGETNNTNYDGSATGKNYGTWATAHTSTWGNALKGMMDHFGNFSITLTSTTCYVDMDVYMKSGKVQPAFLNKPQPEEASGVACFKWYKEWAQEDYPSCDGTLSKQAPFNGTPAAIPGLIQAEDYDLGGEGKGYHDTDKGNEGGEYREDGVDIKANGNGNYSIGWMAQDEWLTYTVNIADATKYHWSANVATENEDAQFHFQIDGKDVTEPIDIPSTGSWTTYKEIEGTVNLPAGTHQLKLVIDNPYFDLDWIKFDLVHEPFNGTAASIPGTIEAEEFDYGGKGVAYSDNDSTNQGEAFRTEGVDIKKTVNGTIVGWTMKDEWLVYTVNVAKTGSYKLTALVSTDNDEAAFHFELDDEPISGSIGVTNTGDWDVLTEVSETVNLTAGEHLLKLAVDANYFDIDKFSFAEEESTSAEVVTAENATHYTIYTALGVAIGQVESGNDLTATLDGLHLAKGVYLVKSDAGNTIRYVAK